MAARTCFGNFPSFGLSLILSSPFWHHHEIQQVVYCISTEICSVEFFCLNLQWLTEYVMLAFYNGLIPVMKGAGKEGTNIFYRGNESQGCATDALSVNFDM